MAKSNQSKKPASAKGENKDRPNGKAWKKDKNKPARVRTPERQEKDFWIRMERAKRRQAGMARHAAELEAAKEKAEFEAQQAAAKRAAEEAERQAKIEAERIAREILIASKRKPHKPTLKPFLVGA